MGIGLRIFISILCSLMFIGISAQNQRFHEVKSGETKYGISRQYNVSIEELEKFNPEIVNGLKVGTKLLIPTTVPQSENAPPAYDAEKFILHQVKAQETLYAISRIYGIEVEDIVRHNPGAETALQLDQYLKIPRGLKSAPTSGDMISYRIRSGDNVYKIGQRYGISIDSIYLLNPNAKNGLTIGSSLKLPAADSSAGGEKPVNPENAKPAPRFAPSDSSYFLYQVKTGDSFYSIKREYNISQEQLLELNPELKEGLRLDQYIVLPVSGRAQTDSRLERIFEKLEPDYGEEIDIKAQEDTRPGDLRVGRRDTVKVNTAQSYDVALMLPFEVNLSDSARADMEAYAMVAFDFYNGFLIAADSMAKAGMNLNLYVRDTRNNIPKIREDLANLPLSSLDLVIGPLFRDNVEFVADELRDRKIPVVSPLSKSVNVEERPNLIQAVPGPLEEDMHIAGLLNRDYKDANLIFAHSGNQEERENVLQIRARINARYSDNYIRDVVTLSSSSGIFSHAAINNAMRAGKRNIIITPSENQVLLSDLVNKLRNKRDSGVYLISNTKLSKLPTIEMDYLRQMNLLMPDANFIDYDSPATVAFIAKYRAKYNAEPSRFSFQGYDIAMYFLQKLYRQGAYFQQSLGEKAVYTNSGFQFNKRPGGGWQNQFYYSTGIRDFKLVKLN